MLGALGGMAGVLAMRAYWQATTAVVGQDPRQATDESDIPDTDALDSILLIGEHHKEGESSTAAVGKTYWELCWPAKCSSFPSPSSPFLHYHSSI